MADENRENAPGFFKSPYFQPCLALGVGASFHPLLYAKTLMQLGHEPLPLERGKTWLFFGKESYCLPNTFKYLSHVKNTDGFFGLYRGLGASICYNICGLGVSIATQRYLDEVYPDPVVTESQLATETDGEAYCRFFRKLLKETVSKTVGTIASRPLQVIMVRRMAQFIGGETIYVGVFGSFFTIYREEGVAGLFSGLVPQLIGEVLILWSANSLLFLVDRVWRNYFNETDQEEVQATEEEQSKQNASRTMKQALRFIIPYLVSNLCYPFSVVSTILAVNGCPLKVGQAPVVPIFLHWQDCWDYLYVDKQLKRGSKMFLRWYDGPVTFKKGSPYAFTSGQK